ncbi:type 1 fimbrial protein [Escherichia coli]|nr:type 1 fimbrial protein [Escherichia coli]EFB2354212.1 type 1 fimbrial protein [Escherichia coli]EFC3751942.1 type 1 fimbrial protein [Escherichia coli]EFF9624435.1 fimbrial protein [Escherichia coli]EFN9957149.1 type 1 fimbrial protein [Escherichia coli]
MYWRFAFIITIFWSSILQATSSTHFLPPGMTLPEFWGEEHVWWHGRANFKGQVIMPACTLAMEDTYQVIDMGETPVRDLQNSSVGAEKKFRLRLRNCELAGTGKRVYTASRVRVTFEGVHGETPDKFLLLGSSQGVSLQILDKQGYPAKSGKVMPSLLLNGNEDEFDYTLRLVRNEYPLKSGGYYSVLRFKVDYE